MNRYSLVRVYISPLNISYPEERHDIKYTRRRLIRREKSHDCETKELIDVQLEDDYFQCASKMKPAARSLTRLFVASGETLMSKMKPRLIS